MDALQVSQRAKTCIIVVVIIVFIVIDSLETVILWKYEQ